MFIIKRNLDNVVIEQKQNKNKKILSKNTFHSFVYIK
jgi:hypothetical protein